MQSYEGAVRRKDNEQVVHEYEEILTLISSISQHSISLQPPKKDFDELVDLCVSLNRSVLQVSDELDQPHDYKKMVQVIKTQQEEGASAFAADDQSAYTDAIEMLGSIRDHLYMLLHKVRQLQDTRTETQKATDYIEYLIQEVTTLESQAISNIEIHDQLKQLKRGLGTALEDDDNAQTNGRTRIAVQEINRLKTLLNVSSSQENMDTKGLLGNRK